MYMNIPGNLVLSKPGDFISGQDEQPEVVDEDDAETLRA
jgi:hypothetical protein